MGLTFKQEQIWRFVTQYTTNYGRSPTLEEIADGVELRAVSTVHKHLKNLQALGLVSKIPHGKRAITISGVPSRGKKLETYQGYRIFQGLPAEKVQGESVLDNLPMPMALFEIGDNVYEKLGIKQGDTLLVRETMDPQVGHLTIMELTNGVIMLRRAVESGEKIVYESMDKSNQIEMNNAKILGVVVRLVRKV